MWSSTTKKNVARLQKVQNFAARIVTGAGKYEHITPMSKELHWLPVAKQLEVRDILRADVSKYRPEVYKSEKSTILKKIHKVALGELLT